MNNAQIEAMTDVQVREAARAAKINPAGKTPADLKRELKKMVAVASGKSTPAHPQAAAQAAAKRTVAPQVAAKPAPAPAPAPKAAPAKAPTPAAATAAVAAKTTAQPKAAAGSLIDILAPQVAEIRTIHTMLGQVLAEIEKSLSGGKAAPAPALAPVQAAPVEEEAPAEEVAAEAEGETEFQLTHESIDAASDETLVDVATQLGFELPEGTTREDLVGALKGYVDEQGGTAAEVEAAGGEEEIVIDVEARTAMFGGTLPGQPEELTEQMDVVICAPEDEGFNGADGKPRIWNAKVQGVTEEEKISVLLTNEAGGLEKADVPMSYLYLPPPPKPAAKKPLMLKK